MHYACAGVDSEKVKEIEQFVCLQCAMKLLEESKKPTRGGTKKESKADSKIQELQKNKEVQNLRLQSTLKELQTLKNDNKVTIRNMGEKDDEIKKLNQDLSKSTSELQKKKKAHEVAASQVNRLNKSLNLANTETESYKGKLQEASSKISELKKEVSYHLQFKKLSMNIMLINPPTRFKKKKYKKWRRKLPS